jgi:pimeloyl-ACP methyl ester carboxylesterase
MPHAVTDDGVRLYFEEAGSGTPVIFVHEFAGDHRSWEPQIRHFARRYRCIVYNARGYPPSDVPESASSYSQNRAADDIKLVLDHLKIDRAHVVGLSMGGFATLHFGFRHPDRALSLCVAGCGYGAEQEEREKFRGEAVVIAEQLREKGMPPFAERYAYGPTRVQFENKDPRGFAEFKRMLAEHDPLGAANTQLGVQRERPSLRPRRRDEAAHRADAHPDRRRGLALPCAGHLHETAHPLRLSGRHAEQRAHHQSGGAGRIQPDCRHLHRPGRQRPLAEPRPPRPKRLDHRDGGGAPRLSRDSALPGDAAQGGSN